MKFPNGKETKKGRRPRFGGLLFYVIAALIIVIAATYLSGIGGRKDLTLSQIIESVEDGKVQEAKFSGNVLELTLKEREASGPIRVKKTVSPYWMGRMLEVFRNSDVKFDYAENLNYGAILNGLTLLIMFGSMAFFIWMFVGHQGGEGRQAMNFGRSKARMHDPSKNKVTFDDVAGADEEKAELQEVVDFLKNPQKYHDVGAKIPRGILLVGPPGTGKTLLARAVAGEAGVPFYTISGSDFVEMFVGVGASRVRDLFNEAKKNAPSIIFIDEIDAVGRQRGTGLGGGHDEREQTLNQLLVEMDGFGPNLEAIVMAATNRPDILDPALLRPGRFDRRVTVNPPDMVGREAILKVHARNKPIESRVDFKEVARMTPGFTGADLSNLLNEAALAAARAGRKTVLYTDIADSVFKVMVGPEKKSHVISDKERRLTAYHEAGHAIVLRSVSETQRVERVTIIPAGSAGGYTAYKPHEDLSFHTVGHLLQDVKVALGGRAAEEVVLGEISTGASGDLQHVDQVVRGMVTRYGMSEKLKNMVFESGDERQVFLGRDYGHTHAYSQETLETIDGEVKRMIQESYDEVLRILRDKIKTLHTVAELLLKKERIEGAEFERIYQETTTPEQRANDAENPGRNDVFLAELGRETEQKIEAETKTDSELPGASHDADDALEDEAKVKVEEVKEPVILAPGAETHRTDEDQ